MTAFEQVRRSELEKKRALQIAQYQAVQNDLRLTLNAHERPLLEARAAQLEQDIRATETALLRQPKSTDPYYEYLQEQLAQVTALRLQILQNEFAPILYTDPAQVLTQRRMNSFCALHNTDLAAQPPRLIELEEAMETYRRRLLLLGEPGYGKTTTLLGLVYAALLARLDDPDQPLPLFERIALWDAEQCPPLAAWFAAQTDLPQADLARLLPSSSVCLFLDGLDELGSERVLKDATGQVIKDEHGNEQKYDPRQRFIERLLQDISPATPLLLTCRVKDYEDFAQKNGKLKDMGAVRLQALTDEQIQEYLEEQATLWTTIQADTDLLDVARTPFLLRLIAFAFRDAQAQADLQAQNLQEGALRDFIFERYIAESYAYQVRRSGGNLPFTLEQVKQVLGVVAFRDASLRWKNNSLNKDSFDEGLREAEIPLFSLEEFITFAQTLYLVVGETYPYRFVHLLLRDHLAYPLAIARLQSFYYSLMATEALGTIGDKRAVEPLLAALRDQVERHGQVSREVVEALSKIGELAVIPLFALIRNRRDAQERHAVFAALWVLREIKDVGAIEPLIAGLQDTDEVVRSAAAEALGGIGDVLAVEPLLAALQDHDHRVRSAAAEALGRIGDARAVAPLLAALQDKDAWVRSGVAVALGNLKDERAIESLILLLSDRSEVFIWGHVCDAAANALKQIGTDAALAAVAQWRKEQKK
jgi:hypothetical protein